MPRFVARIEAKIYDVYKQNINIVTSIRGESSIIKGDYVNVYGYTAFIQRLWDADEIERLTKPSDFGLKDSLNLNITNVEISQ